MRRHLFLLTACLLASAVVTAGPAPAAESSCLLCHNAMSGTTTLASGVEVDLRVNAEQFQASVHGFLGCTDCHQRFSENPHEEPGGAVTDEIRQLAEKIAPKAGIDPVAASACSTCHSDVYEKVLGSVHGKNIVEKGRADGAFCLDCHGSPHSILTRANEASPVNRRNVVATCAGCHGSEEMVEKYEKPEVVTSYEESFHGKKYRLGHTRVPTCVDCHGFHDVRSKDDPASPVFGTNKLRTCGNCHEGANEKFVAAITHQPAGPIPHYAEKGLIVLLIATIAFCVSHVVLEAFADIRDVLWRKEEEEETKKEGEHEKYA